MTWQASSSSARTAGSPNLGAAGARTVNMGDLAVARAPGTVVTYALGSCIAICLWDSTVRVAGMIHYVLPDSSVDPNRSHTQPAMFADTGLPILVTQMEQAGGNRGRIIAKVVGGAAVAGAPQVFNVGKRNVMAAKKLLWKFNIRVTGSEVGGSISRTVRIEADTGLVKITTPGMPHRELR